MESKPLLSPNGCIARALAGEPMFVLLARDPDAPASIRFWAERRARRQVLEPTPELADDSLKIMEGIDDADAFEAWRAANEGTWRGRRPELLIDMIPSSEIENIVYQALVADGGRAPDVLAYHIVGLIRERTRL